MGLEKVSHCNNPSVVEKRKISYRRCITLRKTDSTLTGRPFHHWRLTSPTLQTVKKNKTEENEISPYGAGNTSKKNTKCISAENPLYCICNCVSDRPLDSWTKFQARLQCHHSNIQLFRKWLNQSSNQAINPATADDMTSLNKSNNGVIPILKRFWIHITAIVLTMCDLHTEWTQRFQWPH